MRRGRTQGILCKSQDRQSKGVFIKIFELNNKRSFYLKKPLFILQFENHRDIMKARGDNMPNKHVEYKRIAQDAERAVLLIHGILSTPNHFRDLIPLIPDDYSVYAMVTAGHCGTVSDFSNSSLEKWEESVQKAVDELLKTHKEIYIVGYSMGNLFAIEQAIKDDRVKKLFCIAIPIKVRVRLRMIGICTRVYKNKFRKNDFAAIGCKESYGVTDSKNLFEYLLWVPRFFDLFKIIKRVRKNLDKLNTPCVAYQSLKDELVSPKSIKILKNESNIGVFVLDNSTHFYYEPSELEYLKKEFTEFLK